MSEIKSCPFCGSSESWRGRDFDTKIYTRGCQNCQARGPEEDTQELADAAWNRRATGWVKCSESLPNDRQRVMFCVTESKEPMVGTYLADGDCYPEEILDDHGTSWNMGKDCSVTGWMPLPTLPTYLERSK
jgi:Lar family restriction alleviation protein